MPIIGRIWRDGVMSDLTEVESVSGLIEDPACLVWVDLCDPSPEHLAKLGEELKLDAHIMEDAIAQHERPKAVRLDSYTFSTVYSVRAARITGKTGQSQIKVTPGRISAFALPNALLTVRRNDHVDMAPVIQRWSEDKELVSYGVDGLLQGLLDVIVDQYFEVLQLLDDGIEDLGDELFSDNPDLRDLQKRTFQMRRALVRLHRVIPPMRDVIATLIRAGQSVRQWPTGLLSYYEDLNDHILRAAEWSESLRDMVTSVYETDLSLNDTRMNEVMKKLAGWAAIIAVPTLITGWFGMNVPSWGFDTGAGAIVSAILVVLSAAILYLVFKRKDWL